MSTDAETRIQAAIAVAEQYGTIDGAHHKQWVIDQMIRALLGPDRYGMWLAVENVVRAREDVREWDPGIAP